MWLKRKKKKKKFKIQYKCQESTPQALPVLQENAEPYPVQVFRVLGAASLSETSTTTIMYNILLQNC